MAKKHKHEDHVNHERWLVSYADMVTLLFALFVVLYAMGVTKPDKARKIKESFVQFAFHVRGSGGTQDPGPFPDKSGAGQVPVAAPLVTAQNGGMKEFLDKTLREFEQVAGQSLQIDQTDDSITIRAPLSKFFEPYVAAPVRKNVLDWLGKAVLGSMGYTADLRIIIDAHDVPISVRDGIRVRSEQLCNKRLETLRKVASQDPSVPSYRVRTEFRETRDDPDKPYRDWEEEAQVIFAFSNKRDFGPSPGGPPAVPR